MKFFKQARWVVLALAVCAGNVSAGYIYTYSGRPYVAFSDDLNIPGTFTTDQSLTGFFELAAPLDPLSFVDISVSPAM